jgi:hypothetical protein
MNSDDGYDAYGTNTMGGVNRIIDSSHIARQGVPKGQGLSNPAQLADRHFVRRLMARVAVDFITDHVGHKKISSSIVQLDETTEAVIIISKVADFVTLAKAKKAVMLNITRDLPAADRSDAAIVKEQTEWVCSNSYDKLDVYFRAAIDPVMINVLLVKVRMRDPSIGEFHLLTASQVVDTLQMAFSEKIMIAHVKDIVDSITDLAALNKSEGGIPGLEYLTRLARI